MGRIADLCGEVAAAADDGPEGPALSPEAWEELRRDWSEEEIEDALGFVRDSVLQAELADAADSLSARMVELLGGWGEAQAWARAVEGHASLSVEVIGQLARRVERLEAILEVYRDDKGPARGGFDELRRRLMDHGIEAEMEAERAAAPQADAGAGRDAEPDEDEDES